MRVRPMTTGTTSVLMLIRRALAFAAALAKMRLPDLLLMPESTDARLYRKEFWLDCTGTPMGLKEVKT